MKALLITIALLLSLLSKAQHSLRNLVETPLGSSAANVRLFLTGALPGKEPSGQKDTENIITYALHNNTIHLDYEFRENTCVLVTIKARSNKKAFKDFKQEIVSNSESLNGSRMTRTHSGQRIVYDFDNKELSILAMTYEYYMHND